MYCHAIWGLTFIGSEIIVYTLSLVGIDDISRQESEYTIFVYDYVLNSTPIDSCRLK